MRPQMPLRVSVIVAVRNEERTIESCIKSILNSDFPNTDYEIIVADGASTDSTREIVSSFPVKLLMNEGISASCGRNLGVRESKTEYVAFTDGDCLVDTNWLRTLVGTLEDSDENVVGVGGPLFVPSSSSGFERAVGIAQGTLMGSGGSIQGFIYRRPREVSSISNSNAIYRRRAILEVGGFDEKLMKGQDADLNYRIRKDGKSSFRYNPIAVVYHHRREDLKSFLRQSTAYGRGMGQMTRKHGRIPRWYSLLPICGLVALLTAASLSHVDAWFLAATQIMLIGYSITIFVTAVEAYLRSKSLLSTCALVIVPLLHLAYALGYVSGIIWTK